MLAINTTFKMLLTGTPLSNNLKDVWSLLYLILPEVFAARFPFEL